MVKTAGLYPDKFYIKCQFKHALHYSLNLKKPETYQEKLQWLKLYDRKPIYTIMADKYLAKQFIVNYIGERYIIPTIAIYNHTKDINYESLPDQFVIKTTHDSGTVLICRNKTKLNIPKTNKYLEKKLRKKYYLKEREFQYKDINPHIIIEQLIGKEGEDLMDYKFFCFDGIPKLMMIISNRWGEDGHKADFYDMEGNYIKISQIGYSNSVIPPAIPPVFDEMKVLASKLSNGLPHLRVDFYFTEGRIYVGELTFFDSGGYLSFIPEEYNKILGDWIKLPEYKNYK